MSMTPAEAERLSVRVNLWNSALSLAIAKVERDDSPAWAITFAKQALDAFDAEFKTDFKKAARIEKVRTPPADAEHVPVRSVEPTSH